MFMTSMRLLFTRHWRGGADSHASTCNLHSQGNASHAYAFQTDVTNQSSDGMADSSVQIPTQTFVSS
jgi:hypothetical protein